METTSRTVKNQKTPEPKVAVLAVTVAIGVALSPSARPMIPASVTKGLGVGPDLVAQRSHAHLGGVSPKFQVDQDSSPQVTAPVIAERSKMQVRPNRCPAMHRAVLRIRKPLLLDLPAHVAWIAIHRPIDCVRAAGLGVAAPFIAVAPVTTHTERSEWDGRSGSSFERSVR